MGAGEGMIGRATADSGRSPKAVAPFGGREARLGTNPISIPMPSDLEGPLYLDMATSAAAAGRIPLAAPPHQPVPAGWAIGSAGTPPNNPPHTPPPRPLFPLPPP